MGRIKTTLIKRAVKRLMRENPGHFSKDFNKNKEKVEGLANIPSKKLRNTIAGYLVRLTKKEQ